MPYKDPEKQRKYQRERVAKARREWLEENGPCAQCGSWDGLNVDHIDRVTKVSHGVWSWSKAKRRKELAKCQILCLICHRKKTADEVAKPPKGNQLWCGRCKTYRDKKIFSRNRTRRYGYAHECNDCVNKRRRRWRDECRSKGLPYS
ncbi:hypothetical protein LCGC14_0318540 [marine sediment metagenome]|uniref:HNH nuclease domain-containing protein n=1 Tax=marine sediment metagenome TaxID=412755 RepID=A0A0F9W7D2_9ZZZZ